MSRRHQETFSVERIGDAGRLVGHTFRRGEAVKAHLRDGAWMYGVIAGISSSKRQARVREYGRKSGGVWFGFGGIYKLESDDPRPAPPRVRPTAPLSRIVERVNARHEPPGGWSDADALGVSPRSPAPARLARASRGRRSLMGHEPPGGWTEADRVPPYGDK